MPMIRSVATQRGGYVKAPRPERPAGNLQKVIEKHQIGSGYHCECGAYLGTVDKLAHCPYCGQVIAFTERFAS